MNVFVVHFTKTVFDIFRKVLRIEFSAIRLYIVLLEIFL